MAKEIKYLKIGIEGLFKKYYDREISDNLMSVSDYYNYLATNLDLDILENLDKELLQSFESVFMWLKDKLKQYPASIIEQIEHIEKENNLILFFSFITFSSKEELLQIKKRVIYRIIYKDISKFILSISSLFLKKPKSLTSSEKLFTPEGIKNVRISLNRLSQIVKYASSYELIDYDDTYNSFTDYYNPNLIDKNKIIALVNIIKVQVNQLKDSEFKNKIINKLNELEIEVKKKKVRWSIVISSFFILLGALADLKTLQPNIYNEIYDTTSKIINIILVEGQVKNKELFKLNEFYEAKKDATNVKIENDLSD